MKITKGDIYHKEILSQILKNGTKDENPRPHYEDVFEGCYIAPDGKHVLKNGSDETIHVLADNQTAFERNGSIVVCTPAHTLSINHVLQKYNLAEGDFPIETLRPIAWKSAVKEILWIYQMQSNKISDLHEMGIKYWDDWDIGDGTIGCRYGATVKKHHLIENLLEGLQNNPFGRRHIMSLWQEDDFKDETGGTTKGLPPCCYETIWNVRRDPETQKLCLDMLLNRRSSDYETSCSINEIQYIALQMMVARHCGMEVGVFSHMIENVQIYDRHIDAAMEIIGREPVECNAFLHIKEEAPTDFFKMSIDDFEMLDYPLSKIKEENPQLQFDLGI